MKTKKSVALIAAVVLLALTQAAFAGPFGFNQGMTQAEVRKTVGDGGVISEDAGMMAVMTAPQPHEAFSGYILIFSPSKGLLKIMALGRSSKDGSELRTKFSKLNSALIAEYGKPENSMDLYADAPRFFMPGVLSGAQVLWSYWKLSGRADHLALVGIGAEALDKESGLVKCQYEFEGWSEYAQEQKAKLKPGL